MLNSRKGTCGFHERPIEERFWEKVDRRGDDECWPWIAGEDRKGYGKIWYRGRKAKATHISLQLVGRPVPKGLFVCHSCDNPACVNPAHLWIGTVSDNGLDASRKGRTRQIVRSHKPPLRITGAGEEHPKAKLTAQDVREIRRSSEPSTILAAKYGVSETTLRNARKGISWRHVPFDDDSEALTAHREGE